MKKDCIGNDIRILSHQIHRWIENSPNKKKIDSVTGANAWIIGYISDKTKNNEDVFQKDLEKNFEITRSTASKVVNLMVEKGMVERQSVPWDARLKKLILTDKGREIDGAHAGGFQCGGGDVVKRFFRAGTGAVL